MFITVPPALILGCQGLPHPRCWAEGVGITVLPLGPQPGFADNLGSCQGKSAVGMELCSGLLICDICNE